MPSRRGLAMGAAALVVTDSFLDDFQELLLLQLFLTSFGCFLFWPESRNPSHFEQRLNWERYSQRHHEKGTFHRRMRMSKESFDKLLGFVEDDLIVKEQLANIRGGSIIPEVCLYCTLRYLAGGSYLDICDIAGISTSSFYRVVWKTIRVLRKCKEIKVRWPKTNEEINRRVHEFTSISEGSAIVNCMGVVDGYLLRILTPSQADAGNVRSFFSGHYHCYGVNVQAVADRYCRFLYLAFAAPGVTGDRDAIKMCKLHKLIEALPVGICVIGDGAYDATEHLVPVYQGFDRLQAKYDNFSFYASQLRIRIEMSFGLMQTKWGILERPLHAKLRNVSSLILAIAALHNYCINERLERTGEKERLDREAQEHGMPNYLPAIPNDENGDPIEFDTIFNTALADHSELREHMTDRVARLGLERPAANAINKE